MGGLTITTRCRCEGQGTGTGQAMVRLQQSNQASFLTRFLQIASPGDRGLVRASGPHQTVEPFDSVQYLYSTEIER